MTYFLKLMVIMNWGLALSLTQGLRPLLVWEKKVVDGKPSNSEVCPKYTKLLYDPTTEKCEPRAGIHQIGSEVVLIEGRGTQSRQEVGRHRCPISRMLSYPSTGLRTQPREDMAKVRKRGRKVLAEWRGRQFVALTSLNNF